MMEPGMLHANEPCVIAGNSERTYLALLRRGDVPLGLMVREFNLFPLRYAHESWIPAGWPALPVELLGGGRVEARMSAHFLLKLGFTDEAVFAFGEPNRRIALLDPVSLDRVAFLTGTALHWEAISKVFERDDVRAIKAEIGEDAYRFAILKAPILAGKAAADLGDHGYAGLGWAMRRLGAEFIAAGMAGAPRALRARLALKFPREFADLFLAHRPGGANPKAWRLVKNVLLQEVDPTWEALLS